MADNYIWVNGSPVSDTKPLPTKVVTWNISSPVVLYNAISATPTTPNEIILGNINDIKIEISGTSTSRTITFGVKLTSTSNAISIQGFNWTTSTLAAQTTGTSSELWEFSGLTGFYSLVINPTVISGGNLTIKAVEVS
jgi:hypothetical protein